jgi:CBS domain-containing protein
MRSNPVSLRDSATVQEAIAMLSDKGFSAAPVINEAGHPIGVLSRTDIITHDREKSEYVAQVPDFYDTDELVSPRTEKHPNGFQVVTMDPTQVKDIMTPIVFSVTPNTPARKVVQEMLSLKVHRLFVVDRDGVLLGVISASDVLRHLE